MIPPKTSHYPPRALVQKLGLMDYLPTLHRMQHHTQKATSSTPDELWLCEHLPVYTQGRHHTTLPIVNPWKIPTIPADRGGKITYHGPGQLMMYCLVNLKARSLGPRQFVCLLEQIVIDVLALHNIQGTRHKGAPGLYVNAAKIASIGLRIKNGRTYHGLSLNVTMDLAPFQYISPCGYADLKMVNMIDYAPLVKKEIVQDQLIHTYLSYFDGVADSPSFTREQGISVTGGSLCPL